MHHKFLRWSNIFQPFNYQMLDLLCFKIKSQYKKLKIQAVSLHHDEFSHKHDDVCSWKYGTSLPKCLLISKPHDRL